jgi:putative nucleotidyltransferase with HDIG domain
VGRLSAKARAVSVVVMLVMVAAITVLVFLSGTNGVAVHFYYIPIIWAGLTFGDYGAIIVCLACAALCGPWMPADHTPLGEPVAQPLSDVILRALIFYVIGIAASRTLGELKRRIREMDTLYEVARSITSSLRIRQVLNLIAGSAVQVMDAKACSIRLLNRDTRELELVASTGLSDEYASKGPVSLDESGVDRQVFEGHILQITNVRTDPRFQYPQEAEREGIYSVLSVPLVSRDEPRGVIRIYTARPRDFRQREIDLLQAFGRHAAVAIENAELYEDIRRNYFETVRALTIAVEARDSATYSHSERVTELALRLAKALGVNEDDQELLHFGATLHDIGKIGVVESALESDGREESMIFYRMHPLIGRSILQPVSFMQSIIPIVVSHHENWDGSGFPQGLKGEEIPFLARIVSIADRYERLINPGLGSEHLPCSEGEAIETIRREAGIRFDPKIAAVFHHLMTHSADKAKV